MDIKNKQKSVTDLIFNLDLEYSQEDKELLDNLITAYFSNNVKISNSAANNLAGAILWIYSKINFFWENNHKWSRSNIAKTLNIKSKTIGNISSNIMNTLELENWDSRFARKEVVEQNPLNNDAMTENGFILPKEQIVEQLILDFTNKE